MFDNPVCMMGPATQQITTGGYLAVGTDAAPSTAAATAALDVLNKRVLFIGINSLLTTILVIVVPILQYLTTG